MISINTVVDILSTGIPPLRLRVESPFLRELAADFIAQGEREEGTLPERLSYFLKAQIDSIHGMIRQMRNSHTRFQKMLQQARLEDDRRQAILDYCRELGSSSKELREDRRAFSRWFGEDAVEDRYRRRLMDYEKKLSRCLRQLGRLVCLALQDAEDQREALEIWDRLDAENAVMEMLAYDGDPRVRLEAFQSLSEAIMGLPEHLRESAVGDRTLLYIYRSAMEHKQDVWIQSKALDLLTHLSPSSAETALDKRLNSPGKGDDLFVRYQAIKIAGASWSRIPGLRKVARAAAIDPSPHVRQGAVEALEASEANFALHRLEKLALEDLAPEVRARALIAVCRHALHGASGSAAGICARSLAVEKNEFVLKTLCHFIADSAVALSVDEHALSRWAGILRSMLIRTRSHSPDIPVRRYAAQALEWFWLAEHPPALALSDLIRVRSNSLSAGDSFLIENHHIGNLSQEDFGRVLSLLTANDYQLDARAVPKGWKITRGPVFKFRSWRFLLELRHPAPDKRQAHNHTVGRVCKATLRAPSAIMAEMSPTRVPGEPLFLREEGGWRPYLPLVDDLISCLENSTPPRPVRFFSSSGITTLVPPRNMFRRWLSAFKLTFSFRRFARSRNWHEGTKEAPTAYVEMIRKLGFKVDFKAHDYGLKDLPDKSVLRFFTKALSIPFLTAEDFDRIKDYFFSAYGNSLSELTVFITLAILFFFGRHYWINRKFHRNRRNIPLVVGGWGTRGKSGTERLKAALFNSLGYSLVSKTTGCEAMFLYATSFGPTREMFLFRPYDKATIWEQSNLVDVSSRLGVEVFLWECMGLTPSYVRVLQKDWMRDDLSTITNSYPDHEDLQGPAGYNIPQVMCEFIPERGRLITTEESMVPVLREGARKYGTAIHEAGWLQAGLIPSDLQERFPYEEHPFNIALVTQIAEELGIPADRAVKEMADRVVADLGVLKTYPLADVKSRKIEYVMGMSANERLGCLTNWRRMGFDDREKNMENGICVMTVVNNRADRVARSEVFARILVEDVEADCHFLIGTNLSGLRGFIRNAWESRMNDFALFPEKESTHDDAIKNFDRELRFLRAPMSVKQVEKRFNKINAGTRFDEKYKEEAAKWKETWTRQAEKIENVKKAILDNADRDDLEDKFRGLATELFMQKLVVIENHLAPGDYVIDRLASAAPPGMHCRIMGMQNIKGTGLDLVYRFQAWDNVHAFLKELDSGDRVLAENAISRLASWEDFGLLDEKELPETVERVKKSMMAQTEFFQALINNLLTRHSKILKEKKQSLGVAVHRSRLARFLDVLEVLLDSGDAVRRRKKADHIYADLASQRISQERATMELQKLNKRQKGGWLASGVISFLRQFTPSKDKDS